MSKTTEHMLKNGIKPSTGADGVDDTYQQASTQPHSKEQEDAIYNELHEEHLMREEYRRMAELQQTNHQS